MDGEAYPERIPGMLRTLQGRRNTNAFAVSKNPSTLPVAADALEEALAD